ncbi:MAG: FecR domain-containing protein [Muribaculaceae bacterium]|nr:FecR domain-containing protein [Muribaculaceae bacterium]
MDELIRKFKTHSLSSGELSQLRQAFASMTDKEIEQAFLTGDDDDFSPADVRDEVEDRIISGLARRVTPAAGGWLHSRWSLAAAAAVGVILVTVIAWMYLRLRHYSQYEGVLASITEIATGQNERVSVTLPDGSSVTLGPESRLSYSMEDFNASNRTVDAVGELKFSVSHDESRPFRVLSRGIEVRVLGTEFILKSDTVDTQVMLYLLAGAVEMSSSLSGASVRVKPMELAIMNRRTGEFTLCRPDNGNDATALLRGDMSFRKRRLSVVTEQIATAYGISLRLAEASDSSRLFTGYVPSNNLPEALSILEEAFHFSAEVSPDSTEIVLRHK